MTQNLNYYKYDVAETYNEKYYQMPQVFFTSDKYKNMSNDARVMYTLLKSRNSYSIRNHWFDENNNIYFIFTNKELMQMLNCHSQKLAKVKAELEDLGLLCHKQMGCNQPNRLYLLKPEVTAQEVYEIEKREAQNNAKLDKQKDEQAEATTKPNKINKPQPDSSKNNNSKNHKENNSQKDKTHKSKEDNYFSIFTDAAEQQIDLIAANSNLTAKDVKNIIFKAKSKALHDAGFFSGMVFDIKDFPDFVRSTLYAIVKAMKSEQEVKNLKGYIYASFYRGFKKLAEIYTEYTQSADSFEDAITVTEDQLMDFYRNKQRYTGKN